MPKKKKVMTVELPKEDISVNIEDVKASLDVMVAGPGWKIIHKILDDNVKYLEQAILNKIDPKTKEKISDEEVEKLRDKRNLNIEVIEIPNTYKRHLDDTGVVPKEFDPFFKTKEEIEISEARERSLTN